MVGNIIISTVRRVCTKLQLSLGVLARKKKLIEKLHAFKITSTYQEVRQFRISAAAEAETHLVVPIYKVNCNSK